MCCVVRYFCNTDVKEVLKGQKLRDQFGEVYHEHSFKMTLEAFKEELRPANDFSHVIWSTNLCPSASVLLLELPL